MLLQHQYCKQHKLDCQKLNPDGTQTISPISVIRYRDYNIFNALDGIKPLNEYKSDSKGSANAYHYLQRIHAIDKRVFLAPDSCIPFDKLANNLGNDNSKIDSFFKKFVKDFIVAKDKFETQGRSIESCPECLQLLTDFLKNFDVDRNIEDLKQALGASRFEGFFTILMFKNPTVESGRLGDQCKSLRFKDLLKFKHFKGNPDSKNAIDDLFTEAYEQIKKHNPVVTSGFCAAKVDKSSSVDPEKCLNHCLVLTGYKTFELQADDLPIGKKGDKVRLVRVHNSWGNGWQVNNNDGWVLESELKQLTPTVDDPNAKHAYKTRVENYNDIFSWSE